MLIGGGTLDKEIYDRFATEAGGYDSPIIVIPTAIDDQELAKDPKFEKIERSFQDLGFRKVTVLHTRDKNEANSPKFYNSFEKAKGVFIMGGRQWNEYPNSTLMKYNSIMPPMKRTGLILAGGLLLTLYSITTIAQDSRFYDYFTSRESIEKDGISLLVDVNLEIRRKKDPDGGYSNHFGSDNFTVSLTGLGTIVKGCQISYNGKIYSCAGELRPYFDAIQVTTLSMTVSMDGLKDCPQFSYAAWKMQPGYNTITRFCQPTSNLSITGINISSVSVSGIEALKAKIQELEAGKGNQEKVKDLLRDASIHITRVSIKRL